MKISEQIRTHRSKNNISQEQLAEILFVSRQTISNWENKRTYPDLRSLLMMSDYFKISLDELVKGDLNMINQKNVIQSFKLWGTLGFGSLIPVFIGFKILMSTESSLISWIPTILLSLLSAFSLYKLEEIKSDEDIQTYKEIKAYMKNYTLSEEEKKSEIISRENNRIRSGTIKMLSGAVAGVILFLLIDFIINIFN